MCTLHCSKDPTPLKPFFFFFIKSAYKDTFCNMKCDSYNNLMFSMQTCCPKENARKKSHCQGSPKWHHSGFLWHLGSAWEIKKLGVNRRSRTRSQFFFFFHTASPKMWLKIWAVSLESTKWVKVSTILPRRKWYAAKPQLANLPMPRTASSALAFSLWLEEG